MTDTEIPILNEPVLTDAAVLRGLARNIDTIADKIGYSHPELRDVTRVLAASVRDNMTAPGLRLVNNHDGTYSTPQRVILDMVGDLLGAPDDEA